MSERPGAWRADAGAREGAPGGPLAAGPTRRAVASFTTYREAERAVDFLSDRGFPVERVAIVGRDLRLVEQVTGRMGYGQAARLLAQSPT